jgi:tripartite-type tricarboxylate transporter receptor subunit TctC
MDGFGHRAVLTPARLAQNIAAREGSMAAHVTAFGDRTKTATEQNKTCPARAAALRTVFAAFSAAGLMASALPVMAQAYPSRNVTFVVGYAPGGTGDVVARIIAQKLSGVLGKPVVVENRAGASGAIAAQSVARAAPDGHTLLVGQTAEIAINQHLMKDLAYDPRKDLQPIALAAVVPLGLVVPGKAPYSTLAELVNAARSSKQGLSFASAGIGTPGHFAGELLKAKTQSNMAHVPYKGAGPALNDLIGGHVDLYFPGLPAAMSNVKAGQLKLLAVSSAKRSGVAPDVPTVAEAIDAPGFDLTLWAGIFAPRGTPPEIVARLNEEINKILVQAETKERMTAEGADVAALSVEQFTAFAVAESEKYAQIIKETGVKAE